MRPFSGSRGDGKFRDNSMTAMTASLGLLGLTCQLVFFVSPSCSVCELLLPTSREIAVSEREWLDIVLASDGDKADHASFVARKGISTLPYVVSQPLGLGFRVAQLPHGALVDAEGRVAASGLVDSREHLESLIEAKQQGVGSMQEYLKKN